MRTMPSEDAKVEQDERECKQMDESDRCLREGENERSKV